MTTDPPSRRPKIDFHAHMLERDAFSASIMHNVATGFGTRPLGKAPPGSAQEMAERSSYDPALHVQMLDSLQLDAEVLLSTTVVQGTAWAAADVADDLNRRINDEIRRWVHQHPTRLVPSFTLPLQDRDLALRELRRCSDEFATQVVQLPVRVGDTYLSEPPFHYLWEAVAASGLIAFVHPDGTPDLWYQRYSMWNSVGQPIEEAKFLASLIYEGVLERLPGLKIVVAHGGGYLPHYFGRLDRNVQAWPESTKNISRKPSEYLRELHYDTCLYEPAMLEALVARVGADRIVMGSDYPVGETDPVGFVAGCPALSPDQQEMVVGGTVAELLGLETTAGALGVVAASKR